MTKEYSIFKIINLLANLVVFDNLDFEKFLKKLILAITQIIPTDSCLIYFYDKGQKKLILIGSKKPHKAQIGNVILKRGEGVTGWVAQHKTLVVIRKKAYKDPRFKLVPHLPEDTYEAFLSIPISDKNEVVGVINLHNKKPYNFSREQLQTINSVVQLISSAFVKVVLKRKVAFLESTLEERKLVEIAKGLLMKHKHLTEEESYSMIRREAMNRRKSMRDIAQSINMVFGKLGT